MTDKKQMPKAQKAVLTVLLAVITVVLHWVGASFSTTYINSADPIAPLIGNLPFVVFTTLFQTLLVFTAGRPGLLAAAVPAIAGLFHVFSRPDVTLTVFCTCLTSAISAWLIHFLYLKGAKKSTVCTAAALAITLTELAKPALSIAFDASREQAKFAALLFSRLGDIIDNTLAVTVSLFDRAAQLYPGLENPLTSAEQEIFRSSMAMSLSLIPAILFCVYFAVSFITVSAANSYNRRCGLIPDKCYGIYSIPSPVYFIFNSLAVIYVLCFFFGSGLTGFFVGIVSALIFMLPHFVILAYRRLFCILSRPCGDVLAFIILAAATFAASLFSFQLLMWILAFFGSSEYRAQSFAEKGSDGSAKP